MGKKQSEYQQYEMFRNMLTETIDHAERNDLTAKAMFLRIMSQMKDNEEFSGALIEALKTKPFTVGTLRCWMEVN